MRLIALPQEKKHVHTTRLHVRWADMDAYQHLNNTIYFRFFEEARVEWLMQLGIFQSHQTQGTVIVNTFCNFYKQIVYPSDVIVKTYVSTVGRSSFDCWYQLFCPGDGERIYAEGAATIVWIDMKQEKSIPLPEVLRSQLLE